MIEEERKQRYSMESSDVLSGVSRLATGRKLRTIGELTVHGIPERLGMHMSSHPARLARRELQRGKRCPFSGSAH